MSPKAEIIGVVSGKGGVGKSNLVANLGVAAGRLGARALAVDGDLGLANLDVLLGVSSAYGIADVLRADRTLAESVTRGPGGVDLLPAAAGRSDLTALQPEGLAPMLIELFRAVDRYDLILLDIAAGLAPTVMSLAAASDRLFLVATPEPTSLADAYSTLKVVSHELPDLRVDLVVNQARSEAEALRTHDRLQRLALRFLDRELPLIAWIPEDPLLVEAVSRQEAVSLRFPGAPASLQIRALAEQLVPTRRAPRGAEAGVVRGVPNGP